jgi:hypothetical protein
MHASSACNLPALQQVLSNTQFKLLAELMRVAFEQVAEAEPGALIDALLSLQRQSTGVPAQPGTGAPGVAAESVSAPPRLEYSAASG